MISCTISDLAQRCLQRGYTLEEVAGCIVSSDGFSIVVDETHPAYPARPKEATPGPGAQLKSLLKTWLGITASDTCSCNARATQMDAWGPDECEARLEEIVGWLEAEAKGRGLPFVRLAAAQMVKLAIRRARKAAAK